MQAILSFCLYFDTNILFALKTTLFYAFHCVLFAFYCIITAKRLFASPYKGACAEGIAVEMANNRRPKLSKQPVRRWLTLLAVAFGVVVLIVATLLFAGNSWGLTPSVLFKQSLPQKDAIAADFPDSYLIETPNYFEQQGTNQCGGFASAFVMRHFGQDYSGKDVYDQFDAKLSSGYVLP